MKRYLRHRWSHEHWIHRRLVRVANRVLALVPFKLKYEFGLLLRKNKPPYCYIENDWTVIQVGAPKDTLLSGRSRAMYFSLFASQGTSIIIEPDHTNAEAFLAMCQRIGLKSVKAVTLGAWNKREDLKIYINDAHPASNFTEGCKSYDEEVLKEYRVVSVPVDTIDNILHSLNIKRVDLVSITTNGAEKQIIQGLKKTIDKGLRYICLACTGEGYEQMMARYGYEMIARDDRGYTFRRKED